MVMKARASKRVYPLNILFYLILITLFSIPFGNYQFFNLYISYIHIDIISLLILFTSGSVLLYKLMHNNIFIQKIDKAYLLWISLLIVYTIYSYSHKAEFFYSEFKLEIFYLLYPLTLFVFKFKNDRMKLLLKITTTSSFILSILIIFMYFFKDTFFYQLFVNSMYSNDTRVGFGNQSIFILSIPLLIIALEYKVLSKQWNFIIIITCILSIVSIMMSQSRLLILAVLVNVFLTLVLIIQFSDKRRLLIKNLKLLKFLFIGFLIAIVLIFLFSKNNLILNLSDRFNEIFNSNGIISLQMRETTNKFVIEEIYQNLLGYGIGEPMSLLDATGAFIKSGSYIDNGFLVVLFKFGILGLLSFLLFYLKNIYIIFKKSRNSELFKGKISLCLLLSLPMFILNGMVYTAQLVENGAVIGYILLVVAIFKLDCTECNVQDCQDVVLKNLR